MKHDADVVLPSTLYVGDLNISSEIKDENHNHVKNVAGDWTNDTSVSKKSENLPAALNRIPAKTLYNNTAENTIMCFPEEQVVPDKSRAILASPGMLEMKADTGRKEVINNDKAHQQTENFDTGRESRISQSENELLFNGHPETESIQGHDNHELDLGNQVMPNEEQETLNGVQNIELQENSEANNDIKNKVSDSESVKAGEKPSSWASLFSGGSAQPAKRGQPAPFVEGGKNVDAPPPKEIYSITKKKQTATSNGLPPKQPISTTVVSIEDDAFSKQVAGTYIA